MPDTLSGARIRDFTLSPCGGAQNPRRWFHFNAKNAETKTTITKMTEITLFDGVDELSAVEPSKADMIRVTFTAMADTLKGFEGQYNALKAEAATEITPDVTTRARRLRLDISKVRIETEKARKQQKEEYLIAGRAVDGVANVLKFGVSKIEAELKDIEEHFERIEAARLNALQSDRAAALAPYADPTGRDLSGMPDDVWEAYLSTKRKDHEDRIEAERIAEEARIEAERRAEEERIAKEKAAAEERERLRAENERLQKEAQERERLAKVEAEKRDKAEAAERQKREAEDKARREKEEAEREAREAEEAKRQAALEAERKAAAKKLEEERKEKERIQAELKAKEEAEAKRLEEIEAARQAELAKGDKEKAADMVASLQAIAGYSFESKEYQAMHKRVMELVNQAIEIAEM